MSQEKTAEYLARPLIEDVAYAIDPDHVRISCPHTLFADERRIIPFDRRELLALYSKVLCAAKAQNVKVSYNRHMRKAITERWAEYENACESAGKAFDSIVVLAEVIRERGIHRGCGDDQELNRLTTERNKHMEFHWRTSVISKISGIAHDLRELDRQLSSADSGLHMIYM